jgi:hypothetical protein
MKRVFTAIMFFIAVGAVGLKIMLIDRNYVYAQ